MEPKTVGLLRKFESMKVHAQGILDSLISIENAKLNVSPEGLIPLAVKRSDITAVERDVIQEAKIILDEYEKSSPDVYEILKRPLKTFSSPFRVGETKGTLRQMSIECDYVIGALRSLVTPISPKDVDKLDKLRSEIASVVTKLDINYEKNLSEAINEYEKGHYLASALITGRVIIYILAQVEGKTEEEKIKFLQDKSIIQRDRKDVKEFIIKASKKARHFLSHNINIFADPSDALGMLGDSVKLLEIFAKLKG